MKSSGPLPAGKDLKGELVRKLALICCMSAMLVVTAAAQTPERGKGTGDLYFGYNHLSGDVGKNGWDASGSYNFGRYVGAEADLAGYYGSNSFAGIASASESNYTFLVGPKVRFETRNEKVVPWAHLLFGLAHTGADTKDLVANTTLSTSDNAFGWALGGGADWIFRPQWAGRVKLDLLHAGTSLEGGSHMRLGFGIAYRWGGK